MTHHLLRQNDGRSEMLPRERWELVSTTSACQYRIAAFWYSPPQRGMLVSSIRGGNHGIVPVLTWLGARIVSIFIALVMPFVLAARHPYNPQIVTSVVAHYP